MKRFLGLLLVLGMLVLPLAAQQALTCDSNGREIVGDAGTNVEVSCPADCTSGSVWGTNIYTDDSRVCAAAIHAGALTTAGGTVHVSIMEGQSEYTASEQNGISTSAWGSWGRSFAFKEGVPVVAFTCTDTGRTLPNTLVGEVIQGTCPSNCEGGTVWGSNIYTDDSNICAAATHAGAIASLAEGGAFTMAYLGGLSEYPASEQNDVTSSSWGAWGKSFAFAVQLTCGQRSIEGAEIGDSVLASCPAACEAGSVWGTDIYTDDSDICAAAAHAGVISLAEGGTFQIDYSEGLDEYAASEQNGISSAAWATWDTSFSVSSLEATVTCDARANSLGASIGDSVTVTCPASCTSGSVWGSNGYTADSSICTAGAHAGVISLAEGGTFTLTFTEGLSEHPGSEQNGITTSTWGSYDMSFSIGQ